MSSTNSKNKPAADIIDEAIDDATRTDIPKQSFVREDGATYVLVEDETEKDGAWNKFKHVFKGKKKVVIAGASAAVIMIVSAVFVISQRDDKATETVEETPIEA